jgi:transposase
LTPEERTELERLVSIGRAAARKLTHARVLLLADALQGEGHADEDIVTALGASPKTVARVRKRFVTEGIAAALNPRPQPPRPDKIKIKGAVEQQLVELACTDPPRGRCHWTLQLLADEMVVLGWVEAISTETVRQALKKTTSSRGSSRGGACPRRRMPSSSGAWRT